MMTKPEPKKRGPKPKPKVEVAPAPEAVEPVEVDTTDFKDAVIKNITFESLGYRKADWDKIQALKSTK